MAVCRGQSGMAVLGGSGMAVCRGRAVWLFVGCGRVWLFVGGAGKGCCRGSGMAVVGAERYGCL
ncbi:MULTISPECIES: hypothetical protein [unclassified Bartonella]|uniref:hypothetical protein n=1 Tax=unclassified Bartonella TaxID=2645622 RepID=UPI0035CF0531